MSRAVTEWIGKTRQELTHECLLQCVTYDPETGEMRWRHRADRPQYWNTRFAGRVIGSLDAYGYLIVTINYRPHKVHRLAWFYIHGRWPSGEVDHRNRRTDDNRISNLRECTRSQNNQNRSLSGYGTSGYLGVSLCKITGRWRAKIRIDGRQVHLGRFDSPEDAHNAYLVAKARLHDFHGGRDAA